jgi:LacI family transcriptional regulator
MRVTLADIARATGLGKSTVARVLARDPRVRPDTRARVLASADSLGYRPDPALRVLAAHRWRRDPLHPTATIAVVHHSIKRVVRGVSQTINMGRAYLPGLIKRATAIGYMIDEFDLSHYPSGRRLGTVIASRGIQSIIVTPLVEHSPNFDPDWEQFSVIGCGIGEFRPPVHCVDVSYFSAVRLAWQQCIRRGYQRIGGALMRRPGPDHNSALRHAAFLYEQSLLAPNREAVPIFNGSLDDRDGFLAWFNRHRPDVIISLNETAYWWLHETAHVMPRDVGYCAINHFPGSPISGVLRDYERIAARSIDWLDQLTHHHELGRIVVPEDILIDPAWFEGNSLRPAL